jgi:hypothetical protein
VTVAVKTNSSLLRGKVQQIREYYRGVWVENFFLRFYGILEETVVQVLFSFF